MSTTSTGLSDYELGTEHEHRTVRTWRRAESSTSVAKRLDRSRRTIERYVKLGILPEPIKIRGKNFFIRGAMPKPDPPDAA